MPTLSRSKDLPPRFLTQRWNLSLTNRPSRRARMANGRRDLMAAFASHAVGMIAGVGRKDDRKTFVQNRTLNVSCHRGEQMPSTVKTTADGFVLEQTMETLVHVAALRVHAAEGQVKANRGMAAVHEMRMQRGRGHQPCSLGKSEETT